MCLGGAENISREEDYYTKADSVFSSDPNIVTRQVRSAGDFARNSNGLSEFISKLNLQPQENIGQSFSGIDTPNNGLEFGYTPNEGFNPSFLASPKVAGEATGGGDLGWRPRPNDAPYKPDGGFYNSVRGLSGEEFNTYTTAAAKDLRGGNISSVIGNLGLKDIIGQSLALRRAGSANVGANQSTAAAPNSSTVSQSVGPSGDGNAAQGGRTNLQETLFRSSINKDRPIRNVV